jgi:hypothetical protein
MSDLVIRLRDEATDLGMDGAWSPKSWHANLSILLEEAADELERLQGSEK